MASQREGFVMLSNIPKWIGPLGSPSFLDLASASHSGTSQGSSQERTTRLSLCQSRYQVCPGHHV